VFLLSVLSVLCGCSQDWLSQTAEDTQDAEDTRTFAKIDIPSKPLIFSDAK